MLVPHIPNIRLLTFCSREVQMVALVGAGRGQVLYVRLGLHGMRWFPLPYKDFRLARPAAWPVLSTAVFLRYRGDVHA